ncbi:hypothetical protein [Streptomyces sp. NPDC059828]|uniref:hypothetical protein n=1 Tax=Streptomyces sp. NPDC059828 TaxID=3346965 RepID=UPI00365423D8
MTHRARPRARLLTGGPDWEARQAKAKQPPGLSRREKAAKQKLDQYMADLKAAISRHDWPVARGVRAAAWGEVNKLAEHLTRDERQKLGKYKLLLLAGEEQARRNRRREAPAQNHPLVWVRPPERDIIEERKRAAAAELRASVEKRRQERAAKKAEAKAARAARTPKEQPRVVKVSTSVRTVSGGLPTLGKRR